MSNLGVRAAAIESVTAGAPVGEMTDARSERSDRARAIEAAIAASGGFNSETTEANASRARSSTQPHDRGGAER